MPADNQNKIGGTILEALNAIAEYLDELSIDPRCDVTTGRCAAAAVRDLIPAITRRHGHGLGHVSHVLARHETIRVEPIPGGEIYRGEDTNYGQDVDGSPMPLAKLLTCACVNTAGKALVLSGGGTNPSPDAACYVGISLALKAVTLAMLGRGDAGLNALWAWSALSDPDDGPLPDWQEPLNRAEVPIDLIGMGEGDDADPADGQ
jgi:hypothetical protein